MRLNARNIAAALVLITFGVVGFWINFHDHSIGTARRMGPGYMPMLAFGILIALAAWVFFMALFSGPDPLEKWSSVELGSVLAGLATALVVTLVLFQFPGAISRNWYPFGFGLLAGFLVLSIAPAWRPLGLIHAGFVLFGLSLERGGLFLAIALCVGVAALADTDHRPKGVIGLILSLIALCWFVFVYELNIRVSVWPQI